MKLSFVQLASSNYDPKSDSRHPMAGKTDFATTDGYDMELRDGYVTIAHSGRTAVYSMGQVKNALAAPEEKAPGWFSPAGLVSAVALANPADAVHFDLSVQSIPEPASADEPPCATAVIASVDKERGVMMYEALDAAMAAIADEADAARATIAPPDMTPAEVIASIASVAPEVQRKKKRRR